MTAEEKIRIIVRALDAKRAEDIKVLNSLDFDNHRTS